MITFSRRYFNDYLVWYCAIAVNMILLGYFFLLPRISYILNNPSYTEKEIRLSIGTRDNKNVNDWLYKVAYKVKEIAPENSTIVVLNTTAPIHQLVQVLSPRRVYFDSEFQRFSDKKNLNNLYFLSNTELKDNCRSGTQKTINVPGHKWYLCSHSAKIQ